MKGEYIKKILLENGFILKDVAEAMGETPQNLQSMLRAEDVKTGTLERIAAAINKSLYFFIEGDNITSTNYGNERTSVAGNGNQVTNTDVAGLIELQKGYQEMLKKKDEQIDRLLSIIERSSVK